MRSGSPFVGPEPWLSEASDASPELRAFLREANAHPPDTLRVERLRQRLEPWLAVAPTPPSAPPATTTAASGSVTSGAGSLVVSALGKACLLAVGAVAAGTWAWVNGAPARPAPSRVLTVATSAPHAPNGAALVEPKATPPPLPTRAAVPPLSASPISSSRRSSATAVEQPSLAKEAAGLAAAQRTLASSPELALSLLKRHAAKYPRGALAEECRLFTIQALVELGRRGEAERELESLRRSFPRSPHLARAERLVGIDRVPR